MWSTYFIFSVTIYFCKAEMIAPGIDRTYSDGVKSVGFNVVYGDEDLTMINEVVSEVEKSNALKSRVNINEALPPLPAQDVKCLMSVDRYCSRDMRQMKGILIHALKDDCAKCTQKEKEDAGKVVASMLAHDPVAWKLFLTRSALQIKEKKRTSKPKEIILKEKGDPEEIVSKSKYTMSGFKVRVKRYAAEKV
ncbi:uncharacterized protein LOC115446267 [Manduca sexta]|uniref:uncharacterized protein LOC115446267 n=1 Tax=Manduca sexta TaxID=7130 RepID=UPI00188EDD93|nr:uncharacterized protein LOC115446267 [Manduca sexta]